MSQSVSTAFTKQYDAEVKEGYQRKGSLLKSSVRSRNVTNAQDLTFQIVGTGLAQTKGRNTNVPLMNIAHTNATATLADYYAPEMCDKLDLEKLNIDERMALQNAGVYALGRKTDALIITALATSSNSTTLTLTTRYTFRNTLLDAVAALIGRDVPFDGDVYGVIAPKTWEWLMTVPEFANSQYTGTLLPYTNNPVVRSFIGVTWIMHTGLTVSSNVRTNFLYHKSSTGLAVGQEPTTDISWVPEKQAWLITPAMSMGAVAIDANGIQKFTLDESTAMAVT